MYFTIFKFASVVAIIGLISVNFFMKCKPSISIALAIRDFIKMDKRKFKGFGFWLYCGLGGSGKTLSMVEYLTRMKQRYPKVKIYTNFNFKLADGFINNWEDIINMENYNLTPITKKEYDKMDTYNRVEDNGFFYKKEHNGIIFGFDEIHLTFASQNWKNCPDNMLEYISQQRKLHKQIVASSQVFTRIDKKLREQTNYVVECSALFMGRLVFNKFFNTDEYNAGGENKDAGKKKRKRARRYSFVAYDKIRENYDTFQVMKDLTVGKSKEDILLSEFLERVKNT